MFWSIHVLKADTLVFRPPTPQSIKANTKPLVISFQTNTLSWNNYPWRSCWFQLRSKSLATFGRLLGRRGHTMMKSHFYFRILASWKVNFVWLTIIFLLHIKGFLQHWIWRRYSARWRRNPPLCTNIWAACQPWLVEGWRLGNLVLELN